MRAYFVIALESRHVLHGYYVCVFELLGIVDVCDLSWDEQQQSRVNASTIASRIIPFKSNLYFGTLSPPAHFSILATRYKVLRTDHPPPLREVLLKIYIYTCKIGNLPEEMA